MKFYEFDTTFTFGKYKGKTIGEILEIEPAYLDWCAINLDHFYIPRDVTDIIDVFYSEVKISEEGMNKLNEKYKQWRVDQDYRIPEEGMTKLDEKSELFEDDQDYFDDNWIAHFNFLDDYDYSAEGCGEGFSCNECSNFGCNAHPCN